MTRKEESGATSSRRKGQPVETEQAEGSECALLVALELPGADWEESLDELERLAETAGAQVADAAVRAVQAPSTSTLH